MDYGTPALLFGAISLLMLAYTNRFLVVAKLIRDIHGDQHEQHHTLNVKQIPSLRLRLRLIQYMQALGVISFLFCSGAMFCLFVESEHFGQILFGIAILSLVSSLCFSLWEVLISTEALDMVLDDYMKPPSKPE